MPQQPRALQPDVSAAAAFGAYLRSRRLQLALSQAQLGRLVHVSKDLIGKIEKAERRPQPDLVRRLDKVVRGDGELLRLGAAADTEWSAPTTQWVTRFGVKAGRSPWHESAICAPGGDSSEVLVLALPDGSHLPGATLSAQVHAIRERGLPGPRAMVQTQQLDRYLRRPAPGLLVFTAHRDGLPVGWCLDATSARRRVASTKGGDVCVELEIPAAYELDDFTFAVLWAATSLDEVLLADEDQLTIAVEHSRNFEGLPRSEATRDDVPGLLEISRMWLGSEFCAGHIRRALEHDDVDASPSFWSREQRGEEACLWLLFRHKVDYLHWAQHRYANAPGRMRRTFCVSEEDVAGMPTVERILLWLSVALAESFDVTVDVCADPDFREVPGFVLTPGTAVLANWVRAERLWQVDQTPSPVVRREFQETVAAAASRTVTSGNTPAERLRALADYLGLDWIWLRQRCRDLTDVGWTGIVRPRSRLLTTAGLERSCRFVAGQFAQEAS